MKKKGGGCFRIHGKNYCALGSRISWVFFYLGYPSVGCLHVFERRGDTVVGVEETT